MAKTLETDRDTPAANTGADVVADEAEENEEEGGDKDQPFEFDGWLKGQPKDIQTGIADRFSNLENALKAEREGRKQLARQLNAAVKSAGENTDLVKQLTDMGAELDANSARADFYEAAHGKVNNLKLAYIAIKEAGYIGKDGVVDWDAAKEEFPQLFAQEQTQQRRPTPRGNAGAGTDTSAPNGKFSMNDWIRQQAGRRSTQ